MEWLRSDAYVDYFTSLDKDGGFFYERWGDAPVHSIAASMMLKKEEIHFWDDIAYYHVPFTHCPSDEKKRLDLRCSCQPKDNFDWKDYSCMSIPPTDLYLSYKTNCDTGTKHWFDITKTEKPNGWDTKYD